MPVEPLITPQSIIGIIGMLILAGTVAAVFYVGDPETRSQTIGGVLAIGGTIVGFYFGSSKGSASKDAALIAAAVPPAPPAPAVVPPPGAPRP
jgi:hypothetical protein